VPYRISIVSHFCVHPLVFSFSFKSHGPPTASRGHQRGQNSSGGISCGQRMGGRVFGDGDVNFTNVLWIKEVAAGNFGRSFIYFLSAIILLIRRIGKERSDAEFRIHLSIIFLHFLISFSSLFLLLSYVY
jgi:hypothetical protein